MLRWIIPGTIHGLLVLLPQIVGEEHAEDGDALVVVGAGDGARDVAGHDGDHGGRDCGMIIR